jgi:glycosyltransferase involved in cell wall biosynthesis
MMRILFVDHETRLSGGERHLVDMISGFEPGQVDAHVAIPDEGPIAAALRQVGATVHIVPMKQELRKVSRWDLARNPLVAIRHLRAAVAWAVGLARLSWRLRPAVVHSNSMKAHLLSVPAARVTRVPLVWNVLDILEDGWLRKGFNIAARLFAARVVCISHAGARAFEASMVAPKVRVVYSGIRPTPVSAADVATMRRQLGAAPDQLLVGMVGQIARWKGQDVFVDAAAKVAAARADVRFAIVGECLFPENEQDFETRVRGQIRDVGLEDRIVWTGPVEPIEKVMGALDVLVHASRLPEPFGRVIVLAMTQGTPVVTTDRGAGPELVPAGAGRVVRAEDPSALAGALGDMLEDHWALAAMSTAAREQASRFSAEASAMGILAVYTELQAGRG